MRIGALGQGLSLDEIAGHAEVARTAGYSSLWYSDGVGMDPLTLIAALGQKVGGIELGTAVVRTLPRHPMVLAQQALTANALTGGRLTLGIGPSHRPTVEAAWGLSFDRPVATMRDYLAVLLPLLSGQAVDVAGEHYTAHGELHVDGGPGVSVLVAALGPQMLRLAGRLVDGTITTMAGPKTLIGHICPTIRAAAAEAGRPPPRVVATLSVCVTDDVETARARAERGTQRLAAMPSYAALVEREGGPALLAGGEDDLDESVHRLDAAGVTDILLVPIARRGTEDEVRTAQWMSRRLSAQGG